MLTLLSENMWLVVLLTFVIQDPTVCAMEEN